MQSPIGVKQPRTMRVKEQEELEKDEKNESLAKFINAMLLIAAIKAVLEDIVPGITTGQHAHWPWLRLWLPELMYLPTLLLRATQRHFD